MDGVARPRRPWKTKHDGRCADCGGWLPRGANAVWDRGTRKMYCLACAGPSAQVEMLHPDPGLAGASTQREYERRKQKREADIRGRFGRMAGPVLVLTDEPQSTRAWEIGAIGEAKLAASLAGTPNVRLLHDRRVRGTRGNIDHLVIAPAGVFVVDAKNIRGTIRIRDRGGLFRSDVRLYVGSRDRSKLAQGLGWQVEAVVSALRVAGVGVLPPITPVLCFIDGDWPLFRPPSEYMGVRLEGPNSLRKLVTATQLVDQAGIDWLTRTLATAFPPK